MGQALADLLAVAEVAIISGGDWPQFDKQVASRLPARAYRGRLWLLPTTGTTLYRYDGTWRRAYAELFGKEEKKTILDAFDAALEATGFQAGRSWGERIGDRGRTMTFSGTGTHTTRGETGKRKPQFPNTQS